MEKHHNVKITI